MTSLLQKIDYALHKASLTDSERVASARHLVTEALRNHAPSTWDCDALAEAIHRGRFKDRTPTPLGNDVSDLEYARRIARSVMDAFPVPPSAGTNGVPDDMDEQAFALVDLIRSQNWKNGGVLTIDRNEAKGRVMAFATDIMLAVVATRSAAMTAEAVVLNGIRDALEERGYFHMANGRDIGALLDERTALAADPSSTATNAQPAAYRFDKGWNGRAAYAYTETLEGEEDRFKHLWQPLYAAPPPPDAVREAAIEECAKILDDAAQDWNRIRDPGMANNARSYAKKIRAIAAAPLFGWQDISTAPKDGTRILVTGGGLADEVEVATYTVEVGCWSCETCTLDDREDEADGYNRPALWQPMPGPLPRHERESAQPDTAGGAK